MGNLFIPQAHYLMTSHSDITFDVPSPLAYLFTINTDNQTYIYQANTIG